MQITPMFKLVYFGKKKNQVIFRPLYWYIRTSFRVGSKDVTINERIAQCGEAVAVSKLAIMALVREIGTCPHTFAIGY